MPDLTPEADETIGQRIRRLRMARGMTQEGLALACARHGRRIARVMVARWEGDQSAPTIANFAVVARALDVSMDVLFHGEAGAERVALERRKMGSP